MSQENLEVVRPGIEGFNETGEFPMDGIDPDVECVIDPNAWVGGTYRGQEGLRRMLDLLAEGFESLQFACDQCREEQSGVTTGPPLGYVFRVRDGRITFARSYLRPEEAAEAVRLESAT